MRLRHAGRSHTGLVRVNNEDAWFGDDGVGLYIVCDGVGGRARGEVASEVTVEHIRDWITGEAELLGRAREAGAQLDDALIARLQAMVRSAVQNACYMVHAMGELDPDQHGMSTTATVLVAVGGRGIVGQVGDSRVYRSRPGDGGASVSQLTEDHTLVWQQVQSGRMTPEQARTSRLKNIITRAVGQKAHVEVDTFVVDLRPGDRILLCTDGLHDYLDRGLDVGALFACDLDEAAAAAVREANARGGADNITALFVELSA
ncbi:MAG: serine/threonine-protein phosphatase [Myxococcales bacterium]|nr:serine/threonine-protein phosphatase [Myxococcales bacterium]